MRSMPTVSRFRLILRAATLATLTLPFGCGGGQAAPERGTLGPSRECDASSRRTSECESPGVQYAVAFEANDPSTKQEETAIRRINEQIQKLSDEHAGLCRDY